MTLRLFLATACALAMLAPGTGGAALEGSERKRALAAVEAYLNAIDTLDARFVQGNADGSAASGTFQIKRPHFARIAYDDSDTLLIARGDRYMFWDGEVGQLNEGPVDASPASVLLRPEVRLEEAARVIEVAREAGHLTVTLAPADEPGAGRLMLVFSEDPLALRQWLVRDAQGYLTRVVLVETAYGVPLADSLFEFAAPADARPR